MTAVANEKLRLEILKGFKQRMPKSEGQGNTSPFDFDQGVATSAEFVRRCDLPDVHGNVRGRIRDAIIAARDPDRQSQKIILLAGDSGSGKTHLLQTFNDSESARHHQYVFVGVSNLEGIGQFLPALRDRVLESVIAPSPAQEHLLVERIRAIGYCAVGHLLRGPAWRRYTAKPRLRCLPVRATWWGGTTHPTLQRLLDARNPAIFEHLDFAEFSAYVCDRFLAAKNNLVHRFALRVLLTYLFPDRPERGVGTAERIAQWFRHQVDDRYFAERFGANETLDAPLKIVDVVRLLIHLFSPAVSRDLGCEPRAFLIAFDQAETRNELFKSEEDWNTFFAYLSELYATLPNVVIVFTMTLGLKHRLHNLMERQFRDRIRMDERFALQLPTREQVHELYRARVSAWISGDPVLAERYRQVGDPYLPLTADRIYELTRSHSIREALDALDRSFRDDLKDLAIDPDLDYLVVLGDQHQRASAGPTEYEFTFNHTQSVRTMLELGRELLCPEYGVVLQEIAEPSDPRWSVVYLEFRHPDEPRAWVRVHIVRLKHHLAKERANDAVEALLKNRSRKRYALWPVRVKPFDYAPPKPDQVFVRELSSDLEAQLIALAHVLGRRDEYVRDGHWAAAELLVRKTFASTYLAEVFRDAARRLNDIVAQPDLVAAADDPVVDDEVPGTPPPESQP